MLNNTIWYMVKYMRHGNKEKISRNVVTLIYVNINDIVKNDVKLY